MARVRLEHGVKAELELKRLSDLLDDADKFHDLSDFERKFVDSLLEQILEYGIHIKISEKQQAVLDRLEQKIYRT